METILEARDVTKHYEGFSLRHVSLTLRPARCPGSSAGTARARPR